MPIPNFPSKHKSRPIATPEEHVAYFRQQGFIPDFPIPESVIFAMKAIFLSASPALRGLNRFMA